MRADQRMLRQRNKATPEVPCRTQGLCQETRRVCQGQPMMMTAFITFKSSLVPLFEGL